jgi:hypothetical protein
MDGVFDKSFNQKSPLYKPDKQYYLCFFICR